MSSTTGTFVSACLSGSALLDEVDDWVERWHAGEGSDDLDAFLGFTPEEGALWAERPEALRFVVAAHRRGVPVQELLCERDELALAARAKSAGGADSLLGWLQSTGRID